MRNIATVLLNPLKYDVIGSVPLGCLSASSQHHVGKKLTSLATNPLSCASLTFGVLTKAKKYIKKLLQCGVL